MKSVEDEQLAWCFDLRAPGGPEHAGRSRLGHHFRFRSEVAESAARRAVSPPAAVVPPYWTFVRTLL
ncbi:hypothetical protein EVAR_23550_1 [Eumeta japonica]|uniref:Uncharacterized protein n=1 Tax=Eumeta variegata TaxID=151549 RepID=A0A4C1WXZ4_EUMVA|nr:hypothetical protein EVAR_23550_1 [Eumeta japonica]